MTEREQQFSKWKLEDFSSASSEQNKQRSTIQLKTNDLDKQPLFCTYLTKKKNPFKNTCHKITHTYYSIWGTVPQERNCQRVQADIRLCVT